MPAAGDDLGCISRRAGTFRDVTMDPRWTHSEPTIWRRPRFVRVQIRGVQPAVFAAVERGRIVASASITLLSDSVQPRVPVHPCDQSSGLNERFRATTSASVMPEPRRR